MSPDREKSPARRVGLFDSGLGGLSILRVLQEQSLAVSQASNFVYLADTARCPYGDRTAEQITEFVEQIVCFLDAASVDAIVMACNTSAAVAVQAAKELANVPVYDLIEPTAEYTAANFTRVGVVATSTTCRRKAFSNAIQKRSTTCEVRNIPAPDLVPLVETGSFDGPLVEETIRKYADELRAFKAEAMIFGCTHFPFLAEAFKRLLPDISFIDPAVHLSDWLYKSQSNFAPRDKSVAIENFKKNAYFTTGSAESFAKGAELCLELRPGSLNDSVCAIELAQLESFGRKALRANLSKTSSYAIPFEHLQINAPSAS